MFIEKRKQGKKIKYYLVHTYRVDKKVKRSSRYLGSNLSEVQLEKQKKRAEALLLKNIREQHPFELTKEEIDQYKKYEKEIKISHLRSLDWTRFSEEFAYDTNAIEGSTVELVAVKELVEKKKLPKNADEQESINVANAVKYLKENKEALSLSLIRKLHKICFQRTKSFAGNFRDVEVVVMDRFGNIVHRGAPAKDVKSLLEKLVQSYLKCKNKYPPLYLAAMLHNEFERIHPFQDGNGRVGRLLLNYVLIRKGYPPINIFLEDRREYYLMLQKYDKKGDIKSTIKFFLSQYRKLYG